MRSGRGDGDALLRLRDATVRFGGVAALRAVSMQVNRGEFIALVGANGSGKTTLLRLLHGLVAFEGARESLDARAVQVMVFQRPFMLRLSVRNNLLLALWLARWPRAQRAARAAEALQRVGLGALANRPARALSGVGFGVGWMSNFKLMTVLPALALPLLLFRCRNPARFPGPARPQDMLLRNAEVQYVCRYAARQSQRRPIRDRCRHRWLDPVATHVAMVETT